MSLSEWPTEQNLLKCRLLVPIVAYMVWQILENDDTHPDNKVHGANMGPTWVLSAPDGPHVDPMNLTIRAAIYDIPGVVWIICLCVGVEQRRSLVHDKER